ncbi:MAG: hypothetical protein IKC42_00535, partial [Alistipes sp.]|nr:hypothetical protein [Alistipes sp.]
SRDWLSARIVQNVKSDLGSLLTKGHSFRFVLLSQTTKPSQQNKKNSYVVKLPETKFRLKGFGHLFSKRCKENGVAKVRKESFCTPCFLKKAGK